MLYRLTALLLVLAAPISARNQVWIVSGDNCPGVDFTTVQDAIDAASDGDTILLRHAPGSIFGPIDIFQKSLTIVAGEVNQAPVGFSTEEVTVRGLLPTQSVTLIGVPTGGARRGIFKDNQGPIWVEDARFGVQAGQHVAPFYETVLVDNCDSINFISSAWPAAPITEACSPPDDCLGLSGNVAMRVIDSEVNIYDCPVGGSVGGIGNDGLQFDFAGGTGGAGIRLENSIANLYDTFVIGGAGGVGGQNLPAPFCTDGGRGGPGVFLADTNCQVRVQDSTVLAGAGGKWTTSVQPPNGCADGAPGLPFEGPGAANVTVLPDIHKVAAFDGAATIREGFSDTLKLEAGPEDLIFLGVAGTFESTFIPALFGTTAIQPLKVINLGTAGNSGTKSIPIFVGDVTSPGQAITVYTQAYFFNSLLQLSLSSPTAITIVDSTHDIYDGCLAEIRVDDDAPNDPGPGNDNVSDPLEDGSQAHPFDSIQKAIDDVRFIGTTIYVADGIYSPSLAGYQWGVFDSFFLESENGPDNCIINANGAATIFEFEDPFFAAPYGLSGFTLRGATNSAVFSRSDELEIDNCIFRNNSGVNGGGLRVSGGSPVVSNCIFRDNSVTSRGGGLFLNNTTSINPGNPIIINCSIFDNSAFGGGGITVRNTGALIQGCTVANNVGGGIEYRATFTPLQDIVLKNSIVWGNTVAPQLSVLNRTLHLSYVDLEGGIGAVVFLGSGALNPGLGLIDIDPLFVNSAAGNVHLLPGSPCIDAGDPIFVPQVGETDIDGEQRLQGVAVDLGSDELQ